MNHKWLFFRLILQNFAISSDQKIVGKSFRPIRSIITQNHIHWGLLLRVAIDSARSRSKNFTEFSDMSILKYLIIKFSGNSFYRKSTNRETAAAIEANNDTYCLQKWIQSSRCCVDITPNNFLSNTQIFLACAKWGTNTQRLLNKIATSPCGVIFNILIIIDTRTSWDTFVWKSGLF